MKLLKNCVVIFSMIFLLFLLTVSCAEQKNNDQK